ncbi:MAG: DNA-binding protein WhiA [Clostridiales bacterium]|nr:DNA-binding protein WhiA [Clostridiales bacterium]
MTFSQSAKTEMMRTKPEKHCCMLSELSALTQCVASLGIMSGGRYRVTYHVENGDLAKRIFGLLLMRLGITASMDYRYDPALGGRQVCELTVSGADARRLLTALNVIRSMDGQDVFKGVPRAAAGRKCCSQAFIRGVFLGSGSIQDPANGYRMEFCLSSKERAETLRRVMEKSGISPLITERRGQYVVYVRRGDDVVALLAAMGAHKALMDMENIRIRRGAMGQVNRALNCDSANMSRQMNTGRGQADSIKEYSLRCGLSALDDTLYELARVRMQNPDVSLEQLGQMLEPPASKSAVNYRMRRLMKIIGSSGGKNDQL